MKGGARVHRRPFALHDRDHRQLLVRQAIGLHVTQHRDREQSRRPQRSTPTLTLPRLRGREGRGLTRKARRRHDIAGAPDAGAAALAMGNQYRLAEARGDRRGGVADMDHERAAADRGAVERTLPARMQDSVTLLRRHCSDYRRKPIICANPRAAMAAVGRLPRGS